MYLKPSKLNKNMVIGNRNIRVDKSFDLDEFLKQKSPIDSIFVESDCNPEIVGQLVAKISPRNLTFKGVAGLKQLPTLNHGLLSLSVIDCDNINLFGEVPSTLKFLFLDGCRMLAALPPMVGKSEIDYLFINRCPALTPAVLKSFMSRSIQSGSRFAGSEVGLSCLASEIRGNLEKWRRMKENETLLSEEVKQLRIDKENLQKALDKSKKNPQLTVMRRHQVPGKPPKVAPHAMRHKVHA